MAALVQTAQLGIATEHYVLRVSLADEQEPDALTGRYGQEKLIDLIVVLSQA